MQFVFVNMFKAHGLHMLQYKLHTGRIDQHYCRNFRHPGINECMCMSRNINILTSIDFDYHTHKHAHTRAHIHTHNNYCMYVHIHSYTHTHTHTHTLRVSVCRKHSQLHQLLQTVIVVNYQCITRVLNKATTIVPSVFLWNAQVCNTIAITGGTRHGTIKGRTAIVKCQLDKENTVQSRSVSYKAARLLCVYDLTVSLNDLTVFRSFPCYYQQYTITINISC